MKKKIIRGVAGAGKSTALKNEIEEAVRKHGPRSIVAVSMTVAGAENILERVSDSIEVEPEGSNHVRVGTIHKVCFSLRSSFRGRKPKVASAKHFNQWATENGFDYRLSFVPRNEWEAFSTFKYARQATTGDILFERINALRAQRTFISEWGPQEKIFFEIWKKFLYESEMVDFPGMIEDAILENKVFDPEVRVVFSDEHQDGPKLLHEAMDSLSRNAELMVVAGDPDQQILEFAFSDASPLMDTNCDRVEMVETHRCPSNIVDYANKVLDRIKTRDNVKITAKKTGGIVKLHQGSYKTSTRTIAEVRKHISAGESVMILGTTRPVIQHIMEQLRKYGILYGNNYRPDEFLMNPARVNSEFGKGTLMAKLMAFEKEEIHYRDLKQICSLLDKVMYSKEALENLNTTQHTLRVEANSSMVCFSDSTGLSDKEIATVIPSWNRMRARGLRGLVAGSKNMELKYNAELLLGMRDLSYEEKVQKLNNPLVTVSTIHGVKGGEADHVYIYTELSAPASVDWNHGGRDGIHRLFYVAVTRAKKSVNLCKHEAKKPRVVIYPW